MLSILIVNWNSRELLQECLLSLKESGAPKEIVLVDNASTDGSVAMVADDFPQVRLIANLENVGFAAANNRAFTESSGDPVLLLNPDTAVEKGSLEAMAALLEAHPDVGAVAPKLFYPDGTFQRYYNSLPTI